MRRFVLVAALACAAGCVTPSPPPEPDLSRPAPPRAAAAPPPMPVTAEVEIGGAVVRPAGQKGEVTLWVTDGACWEPATRSFGQTQATPDGKFFVEVFVPQGTALWLCGAVVDGKK